MHLQTISMFALNESEHRTKKKKRNHEVCHKRRNWLRFKPEKYYLEKSWKFSNISKLGTIFCRHMTNTIDRNSFSVCYFFLLRLDFYCSSKISRNSICSRANHNNKLWNITAKHLTKIQKRIAAHGYGWFNFFFSFFLSLLLCSTVSFWFGPRKRKKKRKSIVKR